MRNPQEWWDSCLWSCAVVPQQYTAMKETSLTMLQKCWVSFEILLSLSGTYIKKSFNNKTMEGAAAVTCYPEKDSG